jgi:histidyl-tRNA synthetase
VFEKTLGHDSDVVMKEMYTFMDKHETHPRKLVLRPEGTAGAVRAMIEHSQWNNKNVPLKIFYTGPMFRYERPQKGRYRQFTQFGWETFGINDPSADAELIDMVYQWLCRLCLKDRIKVDIYWMDSFFFLMLNYRNI